jgi:hypothetical protein
MEILQIYYHNLMKIQHAHLVSMSIWNLKKFGDLNFEILTISDVWLTDLMWCKCVELRLKFSLDNWISFFVIWSTNLILLKKGYWKKQIWQKASTTKTFSSVQALNVSERRRMKEKKIIFLKITVQNDNWFFCLNFKPKLWMSFCQAWPKPIYHKCSGT